ncbi:nucleoside phosphorylase [Anaerosphaera multitolerans]|uniref:Nucleoside phosphorylase n=1 Tax=Anaerosphaera multitolerans TaxID=2487351 RepID=A0A437S7U1_9FIRM|nr:nucleoside phosphorylase [Anaerosphaera multitolerans]RVU55159.1 nucleoside phosphorylase [Anaerosphaera multitolerans]
MKTTSASSPKYEGKAPHLMCTESDIAKIVLLPGDPSRVNMFKSIFDEFTIVSKNREYVVGTGKYNGVPISVCSTGIGAASTEIAVIELIELGAKALIRVGGTGAIQEHISCGDFIINTGAIRKGGSSNFYAPIEFPAISSFEVVESLIKAGINNEVTIWKGICASVGSFFAGQGRPSYGKKFFKPTLIEDYKNLNVLNLEMESETIFTLGSIFNIFTGSICAVHCNRITDEWILDFDEIQEKLCKIALDSAVLLNNKYIIKEEFI